MPFIASFERLARKEGLQEGLQKGLTRALKAKFGEAGLAFAKELEAILDLDKLLEVEKHFDTAQSVEELRGYLQMDGPR